MYLRLACFFFFAQLLLAARRDTVDENYNYSDFSLRQLVSVDGLLRTITGKLEIFTDGTSEAARVCGLLVSGASSRYYGYCMHNMAHSIRWRRYAAVSDTNPEEHRMPKGGYVYPAIAAYEFEPSRGNLTACLLGDVESFSVMPLMFANAFSTIKLIPLQLANRTEKAISVRFEQFLLDWSFSLSKTMMLLPLTLPENLEDVAAIQLNADVHHTCDLIHITPSFKLTSEVIVRSLPSFASSLSTRIVIASKQPSNQTVALFEDAFSPTIDWEMSSLWINNTFFGVQHDANGFVAQIYYVPGVYHNELVKVNVGTLRDSSVCKAPQVNDNLESIDFYKRLVIVITYSIRVFADNALGLRDALKASGYKYVYAVHDFNVESLHILQEQAKKRNGWVLQIVLSPHDINMFSRYYVAFHMEQSWSDISFGWGRDRYLQVLNNSVAVWTFSDTHASLLQSMHIPHTVVIPMYSVQPDVKPLDQQNSEDCRILFFGSGSKRRSKWLNYIHNATLHAQTKRKINWAVFAGSWNMTIFDVERDMYVQNVSMVLNIHNNDSSVLEVHRINYLLSMTKCVISEKGVDRKLQQRYSEGLVFVDTMDEMLEQIKYHCDRPEAIEHQQTRALELYRKISTDFEQLKTAMKAIQQRIFEDSLQKRQSCQANEL